MSEKHTSQQPAEVIEPVGMHGEYGPLLRAFYARYFDSIAVPEQAIENLRELAQQATLVYVSRASNLLHFLYWNHVCNRYQLPRAQFVDGVNTTIVQPVERLLRRMQHISQVAERDIGDDPEELARRQLRATLEAGNAALLYLDRPVTFTRPRHETGSLLDILVQFQRNSSRPVVLVPHLIVWNIHPERQDWALTDQLFGADQAPGFFRSLYQLLRHHKRAFVKMAQPLDLKQWLEQQSRAQDQVVAEQLVERLRQELFAEIYDVTGPVIRPPEQFKRLILEDRQIVSAIESLSGQDPGRRESLRKKAYDILDEIAAEPRIRWPIGLDRILQLFWKRMYEGVYLDEDDFERIRAAMRRGPVVFCPSHKSHVDYLIFSQMCIRQRIPLPHIAAGVNLSFWPMGPIFRHSGAFFLRRSFKGEDLYPVIFRTYLRYVMAEGFPIEFFIEGTRSRTGKLLNPKFGILSWLVEAYQEGTAPDIQFFPVSIDYEKIIESRSYVNELSGGEKRKEDVAALVKSSEHLRSKYGKIYLQVSEPISLARFMEERGLSRETLDRQRRRNLVQELGYSILYRINQVHTVTPSAILAFCLLTHRRRGLAEGELGERARWVRDWIREGGHQRFSATLQDFERALAEAATRFARDGLISIRHTGEEAVYSPVEQRRLALDYYRNNIVHHFVPAAIYVQALESFTVEAVPPQPLRERIKELSRLFKFEFLFRSERDFEQVVERAQQRLEQQQALSLENGFVVKTAAGAARRSVFRAVLEHFVECYWLTASGLELVLEQPLPQRELVAQILARGRKLYLRGELQLLESLNKEVVKNALQSFADQGVVQQQPAGGKKGPLVQVAEPWRQERRFAEVAAGLERYRRQPS